MEKNTKQTANEGHDDVRYNMPLFGRTYEMDMSKFMYSDFRYTPVIKITLSGVQLKDEHQEQNDRRDYSWIKRLDHALTQENQTEEDQTDDDQTDDDQTENQTEEELLN